MAKVVGRWLFVLFVCLGAQAMADQKEGKNPGGKNGAEQEPATCGGCPAGKTCRCSCKTGAACDPKSPPPKCEACSCSCL